MGDKNKNINLGRHSRTFNSIIQSHELRELPLNGGKYTWSNQQDNPTLERLDRALNNGKWEDLFPLTSLRKI